MGDGGKERGGEGVEHWKRSARNRKVVIQQEWLCEMVLFQN